MLNKDKIMYKKLCLDEGISGMKSIIRVFCVQFVTRTSCHVPGMSIRIC